MFPHRSDGSNLISGCTSRSASTEDLWSEDHYLPEGYLPSPDYVVSEVQPRDGRGGGGGGGRGRQGEEEEERKQLMDETWDYNYEEEEGRRRAEGPGTFPFEAKYHSLGTLPTPPLPPFSAFPYHHHHALASRKMSAPPGFARGRGGVPRTPEGSTEEEEEQEEGDGRGFFRGPFHRASGGRRKVLTRMRPQYHHHAVIPRIPGPPAMSRCRPSSVHGVVAQQRHLRPVRMDQRRSRPLSCHLGRRPSSSSGGGGFGHGGSASDVDPFSESTPPLSRRRAFEPHLSAPAGRTRHVPPPPPSKLGLLPARPSTPPQPQPQLQSQTQPQPQPQPQLERHLLIRRPYPPPFRVRRLTESEAATAVAAAEARRMEKRLHDSMTEEELRSLRDVAKGRVERKDSLVSDSKFDSLLASLQSLASELEKDFDDNDGVRSGGGDGAGAGGGVEGEVLFSSLPPNISGAGAVDARRKHSQESATDASSSAFSSQS